MKKIFIFIIAATFAKNAFPDCPIGWTEVESAEHKIVGDAESCPDGYNEVIDPNVLPSPSCDASKGVCAAVCSVPTSCD